MPFSVCASMFLPQFPTAFGFGFGPPNAIPLGARTAPRATTIAAAVHTLVLTSSPLLECTSCRSVRGLYAERFFEVEQQRERAGARSRESVGRPQSYAASEESSRSAASLESACPSS